MTATTALKEIEHHLLQNLRAVADIAICEFSSENNTPTLHLYLWKGYVLDDVLMDGDLNHLEIAAEGHWDGGRVYSLQYI